MIITKLDRNTWTELVVLSRDTLNNLIIQTSKLYRSF